MEQLVRTMRHPTPLTLVANTYLFGSSGAAAGAGEATAAAVASACKQGMGPGQSQSKRDLQITPEVHSQACLWCLPLDQKFEHDSPT